MQAIQVSKWPKVFNTYFLDQLAESNMAVRQLRCAGVKVLSVRLGGKREETEIVVDRNPHTTLAGCPNVHVTFQIGQPSHH